ncbi:hypothetical protein GCM10009579_45530 [Streptomyces javensis]|uniref:Uncharacterized protein n=1 Tax=Streptomyces javensis TaxID=114698 RepID=A0ABN1X2P9_9ACTN
MLQGSGKERAAPDEGLNGAAFTSCDASRPAGISRHLQNAIVSAGDRSIRHPEFWLGNSGAPRADTGCQTA